MPHRLQPLDIDQKNALLNACMEILCKVGVVFHDAEAREIFQRHGLKVEGKKVFFTEKQVQTALESVPGEFTIRARNPQKSVRIGGANMAFGPAWGAPFLIDTEGRRRTMTLEDQKKFCKLVQTSPYLDLVAGSMATPAELPPKVGCAAMLAACFTLTDLPVISNPCSRENAQEIVDMAAIVFGGQAEVHKAPVTIVSINPLSPLTYTEEASSGLITYARNNQAMLISSMILAGISGPITLAGAAAMELAESLAGIVLAQCVRPGVAVVCGGTSCAADLRTGGVCLGGPEMLQLMDLSAQMAQHLGLPCRYGGNLTDSFSLNMQAGSESALGLALPVLAGVNFIHQACGILGAYSAASFEKFVVDEELCGWLRRALTPVEISAETLALDLIARLGSGGNFMMTTETAKRCRTAFFPSKLAQRAPYDEWVGRDLGNTAKVAAQHVVQRVASYVKPDIDPGTEKDLEKYVAARVH
jgi:trimethylamine--corrinoid protein Co-methyltransferase